jgi:hypothetical protein
VAWGPGLRSASVWTVPPAAWFARMGHVEARFFRKGRRASLKWWRNPSFFKSTWKGPPDYVIARPFFSTLTVGLCLYSCFLYDFFSILIFLINIWEMNLSKSFFNLALLNRVSSFDVTHFHVAIRYHVNSTSSTITFDIKNESLFWMTWL